MSKNHASDPNFNVDALLDEYLASKKVKARVNTKPSGIDFSDDGELKKKHFLQRLLTYLQTFRVFNLR